MTESIKILADIIAEEMELDADRVMLYNQKWNLPNDQDIFIYLSYVSEVPYMNEVYYEDRGVSGFFEVQTMSMNQVIGIDIFSKDSTARTRKEEIIMALRSTYAQQKSEENSISIAKLPTSFNDVSILEASAMLNRFNLNVRVFSSVKKEKIVEYFDTFGLDTLGNL